MTQRQWIGATATVLAVVALAGALAWVVRETAEILVLLLVSAILATGFAPLVGIVEQWRILGRLQPSRGIAILVLYLALFAVIALVSAMIIMPAVGESARLLEQAPQLAAHARNWLAAVRLHRPWIPDLAGTVDHLTLQTANAATLGTGAAVVALRLVGGVVTVITMLVVAFYMLLEGTAIRTAFLMLVPHKERPRVGLLLHRIGMKFGGWLRGQLLLAVLVAVPVSLVLLVIGVPYPFLIGVIAGIGELIPLVGLTLACIVAVLVTLGQPTWHLLTVAVFFVVAMNVESHIMIPRLMSRVLGLSPLLTIVALLVGVKLMGLLGGLLALPVAAAVQVIVEEVIHEINLPVAPVLPAELNEEVAGLPKTSSAVR
ncbi:MAG TPA: AI-2E family transporter [bacterium]|nr:AI-2E family transporter [bacterium]